MNTSLALILRGGNSDASMFSTFSMSATRISLFQILPAINAYSKNISGKIFLSNLVVLTGLVQKKGVMFNHCTRRNHWASEWFSESPFMKSFPICQEVLNISQIAVAFQRISEPYFIQAWLQKHSRRTFFSSAYRSCSNTIRLRSMRCRSSMIP